MEKTHPMTQEVHELYIAKINTLVAAGRESQIADLIADYDPQELTESTSNGQAA
jgi:hypothetical protein